MARKAKPCTSPVSVTGYFHDVDRDVVLVRLRMVHYDGVVRTELIDRALLRDLNKLKIYLDPKPVNFSDTDIERLRDAWNIDGRKTELVASRPGWRSSGMSFAWPGRFIQEGKRKLGFYCEAGSLLERSERSRGGLTRWLKKVCPALAKSSYAIFAQGVVFAGPLQPFSCAPEGALFAFTGKSGVGKTGICMAAQAIMGDPDPTLMPSWDMSEAAFRDVVSEVRHCSLLIEDTSRDKRTEAQRLEISSYVGHLLGGGGRRRLAKVYEKAQGAAPIRSPAFGLTSSEVSPDELAALTGGNVLGGACVRFISVPVPPPSQGGVFDRAAVGKEGRDIVLTGRRAAKKLERTIKRCYGVAFPPYLDHLTAKGSALRKAVRSIEADFVQTQEKRRPNASSSDLRIAEKFGVVLAGLVLAIEAGVVSFTRREAERAVQLCFDATMSGQDETRDRLSTQVRQLREVLLDNAKTPLLALGIPGPNTAAFRRTQKGVEVAFMKLEHLAPTLGLDPAEANALLAELLLLKLIEPGIGDPYTRQIDIPGRRKPRYLSFTPAMLDSRAKGEPGQNPPPAGAAKGSAPPPTERMVTNVFGDKVPASTMPTGRGKIRRRTPRRAKGRPHS